MKKKLFLFLAVLSMLVCLFAVSVSAEGQSYTSFDVTLTDGTQTTAYSPGSDSNEGRIYLASKLYSEAPKDTEGTYAEIDWTTVKEIDFTNAMLYIYNKNEVVWNEKASGTAQNNTAVSLMANGINKSTQLTALEKIITGKITTVKGSALQNAPALKEVIFSSSLKEIQYNAFDGTPITTVTFLNGSNLTTIGQQAFKGCKSIETISLPNTVTSMGGNVFQNCSSLETVAWPTSITTIPGSTFNGCSKLQFEIPSHITEIGGNAFQGCTSIKSVYIPASVTKLGSDCFRSCSGITSIVFDSNCKITHLYAHTFDGTKATAIVVPNTVQQIGQSCFAISTLESLNLGASFVGFNASNASQPPIGASSSLKYLYLSDTFTAEFLRDGILNWDDTPSNQNELKERYLNLTIFYSGSKEAAEAIVNKAKTGGTDGAPLNQYFASLVIISAEDYEKLSDAEKNAGVKGAPSRFIVYGYNKCEAFYNGQHNWAGNVAGSFTGAKYFSKYELKDTCQTCEITDVKETIDVLFKFYGYSCTEFGSYSLLAEFHVNHKAIEQFNIKASEADKFSEYGVLAALKEKTVDGNPFDEGSKKASVSHSDKNVKYDIFSMKIIGLNDYQDTELFLTAYFKVGDKTYFYNFKTQVNENGEKEDVSTLDEACTSTVTYSIVK